MKELGNPIMAEVILDLELSEEVGRCQMSGADEEKTGICNICLGFKEVQVTTDDAVANFAP